MIIEDSKFITDVAFREFGFENPNNDNNSYKIMIVEKLFFSESMQTILGYIVYHDGRVEGIQWNALTGVELKSDKNKGINLNFDLPRWVLNLTEQEKIINVLIRDADEIFEVCSFDKGTRWFYNSRGHSMCQFHPTTELILPDELSDLHSNATTIWLSE